MKKQRNIYRKNAFDFLRGAILPVLFTVAILIMIIAGLRQTNQSSSAEGLLILENSIKRAVIVNYAIEGRFPESIEYIENNFGIHIDRTRYVVHYRVFASNIFPEITVIQL